MSDIESLVARMEEMRLPDWYAAITKALWTRNIPAAAALISAMEVFYPNEAGELRASIAEFGAGADA